MSEDNRFGHVSRCGGIPYYPTESVYEELKKTMDEKQLEVYKNKVEKYYGGLGIKFPWNI